MFRTLISEMQISVRDRARAAAFYRRRSGKWRTIEMNLGQVRAPDLLYGHFSSPIPPLHMFGSLINARIDGSGVDIESIELIEDVLLFCNDNA